jgi:hypothetical protein
MILQTSDNIGALAADLALASAMFQPIVRSRRARIQSSKADYSYDYADLATVLEAVRAPLAAHGLALVSAPAVDIVEVQVGEGFSLYARIDVETRLVHASGEWLACTIHGEAKNGSLQAIGGALTSLRRFGLQALLELAPVETDVEDEAGEEDQQSAVTPPRPTSHGAARSRSQGAADPSPNGSAAPPLWTEDEERAFRRRLDDLKYSAEEQDLLAEWCAAVNRPHPRHMGMEQRGTFLDFLSGLGRERFAAWRRQREAI